MAREYDARGGFRKEPAASTMVPCYGAESVLWPL